MFFKSGVQDLIGGPWSSHWLRRASRGRIDSQQPTRQQAQGNHLALTAGASGISYVSVAFSECALAPKHLLLGEIPRKSRLGISPFLRRCSCCCQFNSLPCISLAWQAAVSQVNLSSRPKIAPRSAHVSVMHTAVAAAGVCISIQQSSS